MTVTYMKNGFIKYKAAKGKKLRLSNDSTKHSEIVVRKKVNNIQEVDE